MPLDTCRRMAIPSISDLCQDDPPPSPPDAMSSVIGSSDSAAPPRASTAAGTCHRHRTKYIKHNVNRQTPGCLQRRYEGGNKGHPGNQQLTSRRISHQNACALEKPSVDQ